MNNEFENVDSLETLFEEENNSEFIKEPDKLLNQVPNPELIISSPTSNMVSTDDLMRCYIGKDYSKIKNNKVNFFVLLISLITGPLYLFIKKMYLIGLISLLVLMFGMIGLSIFSKILILVVLAIYSITMFFMYNGLYLNVAKTRIEKIKAKNKGKSIDELKRICSSKGGNNYPVGILLFIVIIASMIILLQTLSVKLFDKKIFNISFISDKINILNKDNKVDVLKQFDGVIKYDESVILDQELSLTIPVFFKLDSNTNDYQKSYYYKENEEGNNICSFTLKVVKDYDSSSKLINDLKDYNNIKTASEKITDNGYNFNTLVLDNGATKTKYAAIKNNDKIYLLQYEIEDIKKEDFCNIFYESILNSISFKK